MWTQLRLAPAEKQLHWYEETAQKEACYDTGTLVTTIVYAKKSQNSGEQTKPSLSCLTLLGESGPEQRLRSRQAQLPVLGSHYPWVFTQTRLKAGKRAIFIIKKEMVLISLGKDYFSVSSSHKSLHALTTELPKGHPAHAEQLLQNCHQFNVNIPKRRLNLFPPLLQEALWFCDP